MSNSLNKEHYAALIRTNTDADSPSIGLSGGDFAYTTDGYIPSESDTWESGYSVEPFEAPSDVDWNTNLMSKEGITGINQKIDIVSGGDYAYLQSASCKLVNKTNLGNTIHKTIESIPKLSVIGAKMTVYIIIDGVWFPRWTGQVTAKTFSDNTFTFTGGDEKTSAEDTINDVIIGIINADVTYNPIGDIRLENMLAYRFHYDLVEDNKPVSSDVDGIAFKEISNWSRTEQTSNKSIADENFNGIGRGTSGMILKPSQKKVN